MPQLHKSATSAFSPNQLFKLIMDVEQYPDFLPFCQNTHIHESSNAHMRADMSIGYKGFTGTFQSNITMQAPEKINIQQTHGSLKHLNSTWILTLEGAGCRIEFQIDFEPKSWLLKKIISPILNEMGDTMLSAFLNRAQSIYSNTSP